MEWCERRARRPPALARGGCNGRVSPRRVLTLNEDASLRCGRLEPRQPGRDKEGNFLNKACGDFPNAGQKINCSRATNISSLRPARGLGRQKRAASTRS
ncbi:hypothetical protein EVAR_69601_1 [Eumeta japonica]|uniref:Uncharacterized protein n=1 Tax=Eumeta variegata TaxID=151549 RepID=A0A4C2A410_EUMVA|nr:hypothetical protein EVAR_69601_1 [Eumeta japonica]